jgi:hypothetical protein
MPSLAQRTALRGQSRSGRDEMARGLGYFSIALGIAELVAPNALCKAVGINGLESVIRASAWPFWPATTPNLGYGAGLPATWPTSRQSRRAFSRIIPGRTKPCWRWRRLSP